MDKTIRVILDTSQSMEANGKPIIATWILKTLKTLGDFGEGAFSFAKWNGNIDALLQDGAGYPTLIVTDGYPFKDNVDKIVGTGRIAGLLDFLCGENTIVLICGADGVNIRNCDKQFGHVKCLFAQDILQAVETLQATAQNHDAT